MLATLLVSTGCVSLTPPSGRRMNLSNTPREAASRASAEGPGVEPSRALPERLHPRRASREDVTAAGPGGESGAARQSALAAQLAFRSALLDVSGSTRRISGEFSRLKASGRGLAGGNGVFVRYVDDGTQQLRWIDAQLAAATRLANAASRVEDPDMQLALLRLAGPRLEAVDSLQLADAVLTQHLYSVERLFADMWRWREMLHVAPKAQRRRLGTCTWRARRSPRVGTGTEPRAQGVW